MKIALLRLGSSLVVLIALPLNFIFEIIYICTFQWLWRETSFGVGVISSLMYNIAYDLLVRADKLEHRGKSFFSDITMTGTWSAAEIKKMEDDNEIEWEFPTTPNQA